MPTERSDYRWRSSPWRRLLKLLFVGGALLLVASLVGGGLILAKRPDPVNISGLGDQPPGEPMNVLLLGSDSRAGLSAAELRKYDPTGSDRRSGRRADTIIFLHLDEDRDKAILVSFPRDLRVPYPNGRVGKINALYQDGPSAMVNVVKKYTGMPIHHYVEVNFAGFKNIVNTVGGVNVYFEKSIRERDSGLNVPKGCVKLAGDQALAFVRVRKIDSDFGRIERQQLFLKLMMDKVTTKTTLLNPVKVVRLVDIFSKNVTTDAELSLSDMKTLATRLRGFDSGNVDMRLVPGTSRTLGGVSYVIASEVEAKAIFRAIRRGETLPDYGRTAVSPLDRSEVRVSVLNGTDSDGLARKEAVKLEADGFRDVAIGEASPHVSTVVYYKEGNEEKARLVAARYGADSRIMPSSIRVDTEIAVVLGRDYPPKASPGPTSTTTKKRTIVPPKPLIHECD